MAIRAVTLSRPSTSHSTKPSPLTPGISRNGTTYSITPHSTLSSSSTISNSTASEGVPFTYHPPTAAIPCAYEPAATTAPPTARKAAQVIAAAEEMKPDKSRRFLSSKLRLRDFRCDGKHTIFTFTSAGSALATLFNSLTLGLSAPLCRVYFVEVLFENTRVEGDEEARQYVRDVLRFVESDGGGGDGVSASGEEIVRWLERGMMHEGRRFGFEKLQGNSFSVYLLTVAGVGGGGAGAGWGAVDTVPLRVMAERRYRVLDCVDNIVMLGGRFHNSVWSLFR